MMLHESFQIPDYCILYDVIGFYNCESNGCPDDDICRCFEIENVKVKSVYLSSVTEYIYRELTGDDVFDRDNKITQIIWEYDSKSINKYCINRILTHLRIWEEKNWSFRVIDGYYGQEVGDVFLRNNIRDILIGYINEVYSINTMEDKINWILKLEYGYLLDSLDGKSYEIMKIKKEDLYFPQKDHYRKVSEKNLEYYYDENYKSIRGIARYHNGKWNVIDGYHRLTATKQEEVWIIGIKSVSL